MLSLLAQKIVIYYSVPAVRSRNMSLANSSKNQDELNEGKVNGEE